MKPIRVAAVLAAHNRRDTTVRCLEALRSQRYSEAVGEVAVEVYLLDDASRDGTAQAVLEVLPEAVVLQGSGALYWNGGMRVAFATAMAAEPDHYLLLNDDTVLDEDGLSTLLEAHGDLVAAGVPPPIVAGTVIDPDTGSVTYGGVRRVSPRRPLQFSLVQPADTPVAVDTMNANATLVPAAVAQRVGNLDPAFQHSMGDFDYGLRAGRVGCSVWIAPGTVGICRANAETVYGARPLGEELRELRGRKGLPPAEWRVFARRWAGPLWPVYWMSPYLRRSLEMLRARRSRGRGR